MRLQRVDTRKQSASHCCGDVQERGCGAQRAAWAPQIFFRQKSREKESFLHKTVDSHSVQDQLIATPQGCISTEYAKRVAIPHPLYATYLDTNFLNTPWGGA